MNNLVNESAERLVIRYLLENPQDFPILTEEEFTGGRKVLLKKIRTFTNPIKQQDLNAIKEGLGDKCFDEPLSENVKNSVDMILKLRYLRNIENKIPFLFDMCTTKEPQITEDGTTIDVVVPNDWFLETSLIDINKKIDEIDNKFSAYTHKKFRNSDLSTLIVPFDVFGEDIEEEKYIVQGIMLEQNIGNIIAAAKMGKSYCLEEMLFCIENGLPWFGRETTKCHCVLFDFELTKPKMRKRMTKVCEKYKVLYPQSDFEVPEIIMMIEFWNKDKKVDLSVLLDWIQKYKEEHPETKVVGLDPFYRWFDGKDENNNDEVGECLGRLIPLKNEGLSFVYTHHTGKMKRDGDPLAAGCGASAHGRIVDFSLGIQEINQTTGKFILRGREDNGEFGYERDEYGFFYLNNDAAKEELPDITEEEKQKIIEVLKEAKEHKMTWKSMKQKINLKHDVNFKSLDCNEFSLIKTGKYYTIVSRNSMG